jgi:hypothetical protein
MLDPALLVSTVSHWTARSPVSCLPSPKSVPKFCLAAYSSTLKTEASHSLETLVTSYHTTRHHIRLSLFRLITKTLGELRRHATNLSIVCHFAASFQGSNLGRGKNFLFCTLSRPVLGPIQFPIQWVLRAISQGITRPGRQAGHPPPISAEVKKTWIYTSTSPYTFMS